MCGRHCILVAVVSLVIVGSAQPASLKNNLDDESLAYLKQYGYVSASGKLGSITDASASIKKFQNMAHIPETGVIDSATVAAMKLPRCGDPDLKPSRIGQFRAQGSKWAKNNLTYRITQYTPDMNKSDVDATIQQAFDVWAAVTPLRFTAKANGTFDIEIKFVSGSHGDGSSFDGAGGVLAHAFFPRYGGDAHFDDAETFTIKTTSGINLLQVAAHEFGHSLGLSHSSIKSALMAPFYRGYQADFKLHADDIAGIQSIYSYNPDPEFCNGSMDAAMLEDGKTYFFKGDQYVLLNNAGNQIAPGYPRRIADQWPGLPGGLDAAMTWSNGNTYFFKGSDFWTYKGQTKVSGPTPISSSFSGKNLSDVNAAFVWPKLNRVYFFKGALYYRLNKTRTGVDSGYPYSTSLWGLTGSIDAAFKWSNGKTYFFKGDKYYRYNDPLEEMDSGYPLDIGKQWFGCASRKKRAAATNQVFDNRSKRNVKQKHPMGKDAINGANAIEHNKQIPWQPVRQGGQ